MLRVYKGNCKTIQARHWWSLQGSRRSSSTNVPWEIIPQSSIVAPHCQGDAGNKPGTSAPPSTGRVSGSQSQKGWGGCQNGSGFVVLQIPGMSATQTNSEQSQEDGVQSALTESSEGGRLSDYYVILGWTLWAGQLFGRGSCGNATNVTYLWDPRSRGRPEQRFTARKRHLEMLHRPQAMGCLSRWKSLHHTQQHTMTRQNRGQRFLTSQLKTNSRDLWQGCAERDRDLMNSPPCPGELHE